MTFLFGGCAEPLCHNCSPTHLIVLEMTSGTGYLVSKTLVSKLRLHHSVCLLQLVFSFSSFKDPILMLIRLKNQKPVSFSSPWSSWKVLNLMTKIHIVTTWQVAITSLDHLNFLNTQNTGSYNFLNSGTKTQCSVFGFSAIYPDDAEHFKSLKKAKSPAQVGFGERLQAIRCFGKQIILIIFSTFTSSEVFFGSVLPKSPEASQD